MLIPFHSAAVVCSNKLCLLGGVMSKSEVKTKIATVYRGATTGLVGVKWTLGSNIPVMTGTAVAAVITT